MKDERAKTLLPSLKSSFVCSLKHKTEIKLDNYIKGNGFDDPTDEAFKELTYAKSLIDSTYILYNYLAARILFIQGNKANKPLKSIEYFKKVLKIEPDAAYACNELASKYDHELDIADSAAYYYKKALSLSPTWALAENELGAYLNIKHKYKEAIYYLEQGLKLDSLDAYLYRNLASAYNGLFPKSKR